MVGGVLYTTGGTRRSVVALDGRDRRTALGAPISRGHARRERAAAALRARRRVLDRRPWRRPRDLRHAWLPPDRAQREDRRRRSRRSARDGVVDMKVGVVYGDGKQIDLETGEIGLHSTPTVVKDVIIVGSSMKEGMTITTHNNTKGLVRAFDARTGKVLWTFNTIPRPGEFGNDTWQNGSWAVNGNTGVWTQITVDEELGNRVPAGRVAVVRLLRRKAARQQSVRRESGRRRSEDRAAEVALPARSSSDLGSRHLVGADPRWTS